MTSQLHNEISRKINGEAVVVIGWGRAILMQVAHPLIAAGVAQHSDFGNGSLGYLRRSRRTIAAMLQLTFGSPEDVVAGADAINRIHQRVHGYSRDETARFPSGTFYTATDPALLNWVHSTLVESQILSYQIFVSDLSASERDRYCAEAAQIGPLLGLPPGLLPESEAQLRSYLDKMLASDEIEVTETAKVIAGKLLQPRGVFLRLALGPGRLVTTGLLPSKLREAYGLRWGESQQRRLRWLVRGGRTARCLVPRVVREWPSARK